MRLGFRAEYILLVSGFGSQARWKGSLPSIAWGVRELESPRANGTLCRDLLFPDIHSPGSLWPGGVGGQKTKDLHTRIFFFWRPPPPACRPPFLEPHLKAMPSVLDPQDLL